jgi:lysophospholipase L1-like esterase
MIWFYLAAGGVLILLYLVVSLTRMSLALRRTAKSLKTAPRQTGVFKVGKGRKTLNVLVLGDSIAAASGIQKFEQSVGGRVATELGRIQRVTLENDAKVGLRMAGLAQIRIEKSVNLAIVIIGANDILRFTRRQDYIESFKEFLHKNPGARLVITGPGEPSVIRYFPYWLRLIFRYREKRFGSAMSHAAASHPNVTYIDPHAQLRRVNWRRSGYIGKDRFHPGPAGHKVWYEIIRGAVLEQPKA